MNTNTLRIGVAGAGYWGPNLIRICAELGILASVCDIDASALAGVKRTYPNVETLTDFDEFLTMPVDAVIIATPAHLHATMCLNAIAANKHVFVEKPLALNVEDGKRIAEKAKASKLTLFVGHLLLYHPAVRKLQAMVAEDVIGRLWHIRSRRVSLGKLRSHESVWWSFAPHDIALMLALMREEPQSVAAAQTALRDPDICDVAYADFQFSHGRSAHVEVCWLDPAKEAQLDVFGEKGVLRFVDSRSGSSLLLRRFLLSTNQRGVPLVSRGDEQLIGVEPGEPLKAELLAFFDSIRTGKEPETNANQGVAVLRALTMADEATRKSTELRALA